MRSHLPLFREISPVLEFRVIAKKFVFKFIARIPTESLCMGSASYIATDGVCGRGILLKYRQCDRTLTIYDIRKQILYIYGKNDSIESLSTQNPI